MASERVGVQREGRPTSARFRFQGLCSGTYRLVLGRWRGREDYAQTVVVPEAVTTTAELSLAMPPLDPAECLRLQVDAEGEVERIRVRANYTLPTDPRGFGQSASLIRHVDGRFVIPLRTPPYVPLTDIERVTLDVTCAGREKQSVTWQPGESRDLFVRFGAAASLRVEIGGSTLLGPRDHPALGQLRDGGPHRPNGPAMKPFDANGVLEIPAISTGGQWFLAKTGRKRWIAHFMEIKEGENTLVVNFPETHTLRAQTPCRPGTRCRITQLSAGPSRTEDTRVDAGGAIEVEDLPPGFYSVSACGANATVLLPHAGVVTVVPKEFDCLLFLPFDPNDPLLSSGLQARDLIVAAAGRPIPSLGDLVDVIRPKPQARKQRRHHRQPPSQRTPTTENPPRSHLELTVYRAGEEVCLAVDPAIYDEYMKRRPSDGMTLFPATSQTLHDLVPHPLQSP